MVVQRVFTFRECTSRTSYCADAGRQIQVVGVIFRRGGHYCSPIAFLRVWHSGQVVWLFSRTSQFFSLVFQPRSSTWCVLDGFVYVLRWHSRGPLDPSPWVTFIGWLVSVALV